MRMFAASFVSLTIACAGNGLTSTEAPEIRAFEASSALVVPGEIVELSWDVAGAKSIAIIAEPGGMLMSSSTMFDGKLETAALEESTTFKLSVTGKNGESLDREVRVTVEIPAVGISSFQAEPARVLLGTPVRLSWQTAAATSVKIVAGTTTLHEASMDQLGSGSFETAPLVEASTTFQLVAANAFETKMAEVVVTAQPAPAIAYFLATPPGFVGDQGAIVLEWSVSNSEQLELLANGSPVPDFLPAPGETGSHQLILSDTTTLELVARALGAEARASVVVPKIIPQVIDPPGGTVVVDVPSQASGYVQVNITRAGQSIAAIARDPAMGCVLKTTMYLMTADLAIRATARSYYEGGGGGGGGGMGNGNGNGMGMGGPTEGLCAEFTFPGRGPHLDLPIGTYYLEVQNHHGQTKTIELAVTVHEPGCGNTNLEMSTNEQCDDGNLLAGDGCDAACLAEVLQTLSGPPADQGYTETIDPADQRDRYLVVLTAPGYIDAGVNIGPDGSCTTTADDSVLELYSGPTMIKVSDDLGPGQPCSHIYPVASGDLLAPGPYVVVVRSFGGRVGIPSYAVTIKAYGAECGNRIIDPGESCDGGDACSATCEYQQPITIEREPNDRADGRANAINLVRGTNTLATGQITLGGDGDTFAIDVAGSPGALTVRTHAEPSDPTACNSFVDTRVEVLDSRGNLLALSDDYNATLCSYLSPMLNPELAALAPGRYYVRVSGFDPSKMIGAYFLSLRLQ